MNWEKIINWDEVPEEYVCAVTYNGSVVYFQETDDICLCAGQELIKRPIKLKDGAWYTFTYYGDKKAGIFCKHDDYFQVGTAFYYIADVKIHKKLTDDMWE